jgi:hypothetical protein
MINHLPAVALLLAATLARAGLINEVPKVALDELADEQIVVKSKNVAGAPWPKLSLYQVVNAPPSVLKNLFNDYTAAASYTPNLISARVLTTNPDGSKDVLYTTKVPVVGKISYTVRNTYTTNGDSYEVAWTLLKSPLAKSSDGSLRIEPYGKNQTLLCYSNLCVPIASLPGMKSAALGEAKTTVLAIGAEAEKRAAAN